MRLRRLTLLLSVLPLPLTSVGFAPAGHASARAPSFHVDCGAAAGGDGSQAKPW
ncbi:hypothetical protein G3I39_17540, partial [Streptomyces fulvissimus]|nr:hypothetical protein [Streptomyces microflavus]